MSEIVLLCIPEARARSALEIGCRVRIRFNTILRLMSRMTSLDAVWSCGDVGLVSVTGGFGR